MKLKNYILLFCLFGNMPYLLAQDRFVGLIDNTLVSINPATGNIDGEVNNINTTEELRWDITYIPEDCRFYTFVNATSEPSLISFDWSGNVTNIVRITLNGVGLDVAEAIAYDKLTDKMYISASLNGADSFSESFLEINKNTGETELITEFEYTNTDLPDLDNMVIDNGILYFNDGRPGVDSKYYSTSVTGLSPVTILSPILIENYREEADLVIYNNQAFFIYNSRNLGKIDLGSSQFSAIGMTHVISDFNGQRMRSLELISDFNWEETSFSPETIELCEFDLTYEIESGPYDIIWSDGTIGSTIEFQAPGDYFANYFLNDCIFYTNGPITVVELAPSIVISSSPSICQGQVYDFIDTTFTESGFYTYSMGGNCDTIYEISLEVNPIDTVTTQTILCEGDSIFFANEYLTEQGIYSDKVIDQKGCDSINVLDLILLENITTIDSIMICQGDSFLYNGVYYDSTGEYSNSTLASNGCDSLHLLYIEVVDIITTSQEIILCAGDSIFIAGDWISEESIFIEDDISSGGCDSIHTTSVRFSTDPVGPTIAVDCDNFSALASIDLDQGLWTITWDNGSVGNEASYNVGDSANVDILSDEGCQYNYALEIPILPDSLFLGFNNNINILEGESVNISLPLDSLQWSILWSSEGDIDCLDCFDIIISPTENTLLVVELFHISGCTYSLEYVIAVSPIYDIYIPNVISPNNDGTNDFWTFYSSDEGITVLQCDIYDRWGNLIFKSQSESTLRWDGSFKGDPVIDGVYSYYLVLSDPEGNEYIFSGDLTVIR